MSDKNKSKLNVILILVFVLFSSFLRFKKITYQSLWLDELFSINLTLQFPSVLKIINYFRFNDVHPPFYYIMLLIWERMFGIGEFSGRALSSIFEMEIKKGQATFLVRVQ